MNQLTRFLVWFTRLHHCRGFGIQSPTDYWLVRYVINEHWPYYQYEALSRGEDWLRSKLGQLYMRLANWRQPHAITAHDYHAYWNAGCQRATVTPTLTTPVELMLTDIAEADTLLDTLEGCTNDQSVVIVESLWRDKAAWQRLVNDSRCTITFDLYYCGIIMFDSKRTKQNYVINF
jgi:hypothetical protein